ncbi:uncharacterized protein FOMMEDRAFT_27062 [Fomitiporia mediterranea MF3/22]|uniref:uncharacterized protein n=1 Tax=Fomitiporia mediterranea (strain MF3/22) TaxID=694068 RepID=UPI000440983B|nr:uncharacterized protein FOMMEDRAFT_27062 [Fomitiporia mediterranea MF3/22]EJD04728.1 hypothetical protein FOMMEDRAFT_27062 [Fomitiporia mediterranea MF3/22]
MPRQSAHMNLFIRFYAASIDPSAIPDVVFAMFIYQYFQVAIVTVLTYDAIITMDNEVKYFWKKLDNFVNVVYFLNRYSGILGAVSYLFWSAYGMNLALMINSILDATLLIGLRTFPLLTYQEDWITIILIDYILLIRVLALYSQVNQTFGVGAFPDGITVCGHDSILNQKLGIVDWYTI